MYVKLLTKHVAELLPVVYDLTAAETIENYSAEKTNLVPRKSFFGDLITSADSVIRVIGDHRALRAV